MTKHLTALGHALWGVVRVLLRIAYHPCRRAKHPAHRMVWAVIITSLLAWGAWEGWHTLGRALTVAGRGVRHVFAGAKHHGHHAASAPDWGLYVAIGAALLVLAVVVAEWGHRRAKAARAEQGKLAEEARSHKAASGVWLVAPTVLGAVPTGLSQLSFGWRTGLCLGVVALGFWRAWSLGGGAGETQAGEAKWHAALRVAAAEDKAPMAAVVVGGAGVALGLASLAQYGGDVLLVVGMFVLAVRRGPSAQAYLEDERRFREVFAAAAGADKVAAVKVRSVPGSPSGAVATLTRDCGAPVVARTAEVVRVTLGEEFVVEHDGVGRTIKVRPEALIADTAPMPTVPETDWHVLPLGVTRGDRVVSIDVGQDPHCLVTGKTGSGKTVAITNLATQALLRGWELAVVEVVKGGVDFKPLQPWCRVVATELEQAAETLETVVQQVHARRVMLDQHAATKVVDLPDEIRPRPMLVVIDETFSLLSRIQSKTEAAQAINAVKDRIDDAIGRLAREARFASVHLILGMQRPDASVFAGEVKANTGVRILCGQSDEVARRMCLRDANNAPVVHRGAKGRAVIESEADDARLVQVYYSSADQLPAVLHAAGVPFAEPLELVSPEPKPVKGKGKTAPSGSSRSDAAPSEPKPAGRRPKSAAAVVVGDDGPPLPPLGDVS